MMAEDAEWIFELAGDYSPELEAFADPTCRACEQIVEMHSPSVAWPTTDTDERIRTEVTKGSDIIRQAKSGAN